MIMIDRLETILMKIEEWNSKDNWRKLDGEIESEVYYEEEMLMTDLVCIAIESYIIDHKDVFKDECQFETEDEMWSNVEYYVNEVIPGYLENGDYAFMYFDGNPNEMWSTFKIAKNSIK